MKISKKVKAMLPYLKKYILEANNKDSVPEAILGSGKAVSDFAGFWDNNAEHFVMATTVLLHEFLIKNDVTPKQRATYIKAHADIGGLFEACLKEYEKPRR